MHLRRLLPEIILVLALSGCLQAAEAPPANGSATTPATAEPQPPETAVGHGDASSEAAWSGRFTIDIAKTRLGELGQKLEARAYDIPVTETADLAWAWTVVDRDGAMVSQSIGEQVNVDVPDGEARFVRLEGVHVPTGQARVNAIALIGEGRIPPEFRGCDGGVNGLGPGCSDFKFVMPQGADRFSIRADPLMPGNLQEGTLQILDPSGDVLAEDDEGWFDPNFDLYFYRAGVLDKEGLEPGEWTARFVPDVMVWGDVGFQGDHWVQEELLHWPTFPNGWEYDEAVLDAPLPGVVDEYALIVHSERRYGTVAPTDVFIEGRSDIFNRDVPPGDHVMHWRITDQNGTLVDSHEGRAFNATLPVPGQYHVTGAAYDAEGRLIAEATKPVTASGQWSTQISCNAMESASGQACNSLDVYLPENVSFVHGQAVPYRVGDAQSEHEVFKEGRLLLWPPEATSPIVGTFVETNYGSWSYVRGPVDVGIPAGIWRLEWEPDMSIMEEGTYLLRAGFD